MRTLLLVIVLGLAVLGCGNGESAGGSTDDSSVAEVQSDGIVGVWEVTEVLRGEDISNTGVIYEFNANGEMHSSSGALKIDGTYTIVGDTLKLILGGIDMDVLIDLDGDKLTFEIVNGPQTFLLERQ
ncbi:MAG: hypothetical protein KAR44_02975 [Candidatus Aegiribacteria sp.]|nr:hypothetical protein [Candidatus Aegiribacteria sp.]